MLTINNNNNNNNNNNYNNNINININNNKNKNKFNELYKVENDIDIRKKHLIINGNVDNNNQFEDFYDTCKNENDFTVEENLTNVNKNNNIFNEKLNEAFENEDEELIKDLVSKGANINQSYKEGYTLLTYACFHKTNMIKILIELDASINEKDENGNFPINLVLYNKNLDMLKYLVEHGADINKKDSLQRTPLYIACEIKNCEMIKYLVDKEAEIETSDTDKLNLLINNCQLDKLLMISCKYGNEVLFNYLMGESIKRVGKIDINRVNENGDTPLIEACKIENIKFVNYLITKGAEINHSNNKGNTPLIEA
eukprot:jgi/Orpsp1_1/1178065/evm.model.c7180000063892.1